MSKTFAVIDCETTGFGKLDRMLEIAVVVLDAATLKTVDEFDTLLNPLRDVGRSDIHGIQPSMLAAAPTFEEVLGGLSRRIDGSILVGHNLGFDARFLAQECALAETTFHAGVGICTYGITREKLAAAAERHHIALDGHHRALVDARATAELFRRVLDGHDGCPATLATSSQTPTARTLRREAVGAPNTTPLARLLSRACYPSSLEACVTYFDMLDPVLADGVITSDEQSVLDEQIALLQLSPPQICGMHEAYFKSVLRAVERDGRISEDERSLLQSIAAALRLDSAVLPDVTSPRTTANEAGLPQGARICFTGTAVDRNGVQFERTQLEQIAASHGFQPVSSVSKKSCDLLVAADPESSSTKAQKARQYGVPVLSAAQFLSAVGG
jgi:DNA polymerase-3 subunit epsilon